MDIECRERDPCCAPPRGVNRLLESTLARVGPRQFQRVKDSPVMSLKSLLLCSDEKIVRVLRRVLGDLDIEIELCPRADAALRRLTRQRFEAIIVDITEDGATEVLQSARAAACNRHAIAVAIVDP